LYDPHGVAIDSAGNVYIADTLNNRIRKVSNGIITTVAGGGSQGLGDGGPATSAQLSAPIGVAVDSAGNLYIADLNNYRIRKVSNGVITTVPGTVGLTPLGVAVDSAGGVYIAARQNRIIKISNGAVSTLAGNESYEARSVAVDDAGNVYFAEVRNDSGVIRKI
jgi:DNA-binding beta-propeller fold protein YncE